MQHDLRHAFFTVLQDIEDMFGCIDKDNSGTIEFYEFLVYLSVSACCVCIIDNSMRTYRIGSTQEQIGHIAAASPSPPPDWLKHMHLYIPTARKL